MAVFFQIAFPAALFAGDPPSSICIQGSPKKTQIHDQIVRGTGPTGDHFLAHYHREKDLPAQNQKDNKSPSCPPTQPMVVRLRQSLQKIRSAVALGQIEEKCVQAALRRNNTTNGFFCATENSAPKAIGAPGPQGPCISTEVSSYLTWAVNKAIACLNDENRPLDPLVIFKKLNNETGFSFFASSSGGVGLGQLTTPAIRQIEQNSNLVQSVLNSTRPACRPFKSALQSLPKPSSLGKTCNWLESSEGLARNLIFSIGYFLETRDKLAAAMTYHFRRQSIANADYFNYGALALYGAQGLDAQKYVILAAKRYPRDFPKFYQEASQNAVYLDQVQAKYLEVLANAGLENKPGACVH